ncbi:MAG: hypothetical protein HW388_331 [Dehalococcoidia bacterium]|nr:hypothetical protein [Dehalococcoidia bacterium]
MEIESKFTSTDHGRDEAADRLLAQAILRSGDGRDQRSRPRPAEASEQHTEMTEADGMKAVHELYAELREQISKLLVRAAAVKRDAETDRRRVWEEREQARTIRQEAERAGRQLEAEARQRAAQLLRETLEQAEEQAMSIRRLAADEMRKMLDDTAALCRVAQKDLEAQKMVGMADGQAKPKHLGHASGEENVRPPASAPTLAGSRAAPNGAAEADLWNAGPDGKME